MRFFILKNNLYFVDRKKELIGYIYRTNILFKIAWKVRVPE